MTRFFNHFCVAFAVVGLIILSLVYVVLAAVAIAVDCLFWETVHFFAKKDPKW